jgi:hypothetical protein
MTRSTADGLPYLDMLDPGFRPDGPEVRAARAEHWCARTPVGLAVLGHRQLFILLTDRRLVQAARELLTMQGLTDGPLVEWMNTMILNVEGADHARLRRLVNRAFTPRAVARLRPMMRRITDALADSFPTDGRVDLMTGFADRYPAQVICELLGVPARRHDEFRRWANDLGLAFGFRVAQERDRIETALAGLYAATDELIATRQRRPGSDLLSTLITARDGGDRLSAAELRTMVATLLFGGQDTTRHQFGRAMELFARHPGQWTALARRPELAAQAVEECLRLAPATPLSGRITTADLQLDGVRIPAGTVLSLLLVAGNTDPSVFGPDADRFDITVTRPPVLTFGGGIHFCLGSVLARAELTEALPILARRLGPFRVAQPPQQRHPLGTTGPVSLPIHFGPALHDPG